MKKYPITTAVLFITLICFLGKSLISYETFGLHSLLSNNFKVVQLLTYPLLHGNILHLAINLLMFYVFSKPIEKKIGSFKTLLIFIFLSISTGLYFILSNITGSCLIGMSGVCYGLMAYYAMIKPNTKFNLFFLYKVNIKYLVVIVVIIESILLFFNKSIAHDVHLIGVLFGLILSILWQNTHVRIAER